MELLGKLMKKSCFSVVLALVLTLTIAGSAFAVTQFVTGGDCKDLKNDGIRWDGTVSIHGKTVEQWRDRIVVKIFDPTNVEYGAGKKIVKELILYAASSNTAYNCQQLTTPANPFNSFSCNSFPKNAVISKVVMRVVPNFQAAPPNPVITGAYKANFIELVNNTTILEGSFTVDQMSTACAWNQPLQEWVPNPTGVPATKQFIYQTELLPNCGGVMPLPKQQLNFLELSSKPFTIVSLPLNETFNPARVRFYADRTYDKFDYTLTLYFTDNSSPKNTLTLQYVYPRNSSPTSIVPTLGAGWAGAKLPIRLESGILEIDRGATTPSNLPSKADFKFTFYYANIDPSLGIQNSMFHFEREMSVIFSAVCNDPTVLSYRTVNGTFDPCLTSKQTFHVDFTDPGTGDGYIPIAPGLPGSLAGSGANVNYVQIGKTFATAIQRHMYFEVEYCVNSNCTQKERQSGTYIHRIYVDDAEVDNRWWHYIGMTDANTRSFSVIPMKLFGSPPTRPFQVNGFDMTANRAGTFFVRALIPSLAMTGPGDKYPNNALMEFYVTVPEKTGTSTCVTSGSDGFYQLVWDGCGDDHALQKVTAEAVKEQYGFVSNYSALPLEYLYDPGKSSLVSAANITELECEWQLLADGYSLTGAACYADKIILPPFTRAIIKSIKLDLPTKPGCFQNETLNEFVMAYSRPATHQNTNLFINAECKECGREPIPDTGYTLRSPAPLKTADQSGFIFTGNKLQIPAIGLGMEWPIEIVHVNYLNGKDLSGGYNLKVLGGYVGELEGGAYLPYPGNTVLTGHYYSQGVFVNLTSLHMDDEIIIYGTDGFKYTYRVNNSFWTEPNDAYMMFQPNGERSLTLVTCDDYNFIEDKYLKRYIVQATIDTIEPYEME